MPYFTPMKAVKSPMQRMIRGLRRAPNVFLLKDGAIVEGGFPHEDTVSRAFLFGHEPVGVSDREAKLLLDYGFDLIPDTVMGHKFDRHSKVSWKITLKVSGGDYARGCDADREAWADFTVRAGDDVIAQRSVPWFFRENQIQFGYFIDNVDHEVEVVLRNSALAQEPYTAVFTARVK